MNTRLYVNVFLLGFLTGTLSSCSSNNPLSPGPVIPVFSKVLINELDLGTPDAIEICNTGTDTVNIQGWILQAGDVDRVQRFVLPSKILHPNEYLILCEGSGASFPEGATGDSVLYLGNSIEGYTNIGWSNSTEGGAALYNSSGTLADFVKWGIFWGISVTTGNWSGSIVPIPPAASTIGRNILSTDTNTGSDFMQLIGTMGRINNANPIILSTIADDGLQGYSYEFKIRSSSPAEPLMYSLSSGSLPAGLTLTSDGYIRGTPLASGDFRFEVRALDSQIPSKPALATITLHIFSGSLSFTKSALLVNGVSWDTYTTEIRNAYTQKAFWGNTTIDFWDTFDTPSGGYPTTLPAPRGHGPVSLDVLGEYSTVIWVGNNYDGDLTDWLNSPVFSYIKFGGNLILMTRYAQDYIDEEFRNYLGITWAEAASSSLLIQNCIAVYSGLTSIAVTANNHYVDVFNTSLLTSESNLLFKETLTFSGERGLGVWKKPANGGKYRQTGGQVVLLCFRPYRVNSSDLKTNVEYIINTLFN